MAAGVVVGPPRGPVPPGLRRGWVRPAVWALLRRFLLRVPAFCHHLAGVPPWLPCVTWRGWPGLASVPVSVVPNLSSRLGLAAVGPLAAGGGVSLAGLPGRGGFAAWDCGCLVGAWRGPCRPRWSRLFGPLAAGGGPWAAWGLPHLPDGQLGGCSGGQAARSRGWVAVRLGLPMGVERRFHRWLAGSSLALWTSPRVALLPPWGDLRCGCGLLFASRGPG